MQGIIYRVFDSVPALRNTFYKWTKSHFDMFFDPETNALNSVYFRMPRTRLGMFVERSHANVGFGHARSKGNFEFFLWRIQGCFSIENTEFNPQK